MADGVTIRIEGTERINAQLEKLKGMSARKRDVTKIFSTNMNVLKKAAQAAAPIGKRKTSSRKYESRVHMPGTLRRAIKFKTSKRYGKTWYVVPERGKSKRFDAWYAHYVGFGTKSGQRANPFMDRAWSATKERILSGIENGLYALIQQIWRGQ